MNVFTILTNFFGKLTVIGLFVLCFLGLSGCENNNLAVDVSTSRVDLKFDRFDHDLFNDKSTAVVHQEMYQKYGTFYRLFVEQILRLGRINDTMAQIQLDGFRNDREIAAMVADVEAAFPALGEFESIISDGFSHYKHHFPDSLIPRLVVFNSAFNASVMATDSVLAVGLDMYLGADYRLYPRLRFPNYKTRKFDRAYLPYDCVKGWVASSFMPLDDEATLLDHMLQAGKLYYVMDACFPSAPDSLKIGFKQSQLDWCEDNEFNMWSYLIQNEQLYSMKNADIVKMMGEGPFTTGFDKESPAETGAWIGLQIIRKYMQESQATLADLLKEERSKQILLKSGYKPK